jgi:hypothetical protein
METNLKKWTRWTETTQEFPKPKYAFTEHLKFIGDSITTFPMNKADYIRFKDAAKFWAWYHDKKVSIKKDRKPDDMCTVTVTLLAHHRKDNYRVLPDGLKDCIKIFF